MDSEEGNSKSVFEYRLTEIFKEFMTGITKLDVIWNAGNQLLHGFQQGLVRACLVGLQDQLSKVRAILDELERLLADAENLMKNVHENLSCPVDIKLNDDFDKEETLEKDELSFACLLAPMNLFTLIGVIYSMVRQDAVMQEKIVTALNFKTTSEELESYNLMWSLRPFVKDEVIRQAWELIPQ